MIKGYVITKNGVRYSSSGVFDTESDALEWLQETHNGRGLMGLIDEGYRVDLVEFTTFGFMIDAARCETKETYTNFNKAKKIEEYLLRVENTLNTEKAVGRVVLIDANTINKITDRFWLLDTAIDEKKWIVEATEVIEYLYSNDICTDALLDLRSEPLSKEQWVALYDNYNMDENGNLLI